MPKKPYLCKLGSNQTDCLRSTCKMQFEMIYIYIYIYICNTFPPYQKEDSIRKFGKKYVYVAEAVEYLPSRLCMFLETQLIFLHDLITFYEARLCIFALLTKINCFCGLSSHEFFCMPSPFAVDNRQKF